jgi:carboxylesterase type B
LFRIRYANAIRWKPPVDLASEVFANGSFKATSFGPCCPQPHNNIYIPEQDEQCLYLNIYKPIVSSNHTLSPVLVWIHGGAHIVGCSSQSIPLLFNGTNMIANSPPDQPVIIITINYRLGPLADMYLKELIEENPQEWPTAGNYMYLDMLSALRWIKTNIKDYGGDSNSVSIFGESAGGLSVIDLGAVKGSANLYRTAISQSALSSPGTYSSYYNMSDALDYSNSVVQRLNCTNDDKQKVLSCLRNSSIDNLIKAYGSRYTRPIIDNYFFPLYPPLSIQNGTYNNISLIMGNNDYEQPICSQYPDMNLTQAIALLTQSVEQRWIPLIVDYYHLNNCSSDRNANNSRCCDIVRLILMDKIFDCDIRRLFNSFYLKYGPQYENNKLFSYHLNCYPECPAIPDQGRCQHGSEQAYVFGTTSNWYSQGPVNCTWDNQTRLFSNEIISHWINTAITGKPLSQWPYYDPSSPKYFHITPDHGFLPETWNRNCSFFDEMEAKGVLETFGWSSYLIKERIVY